MSYPRILALAAAVTLAGCAPGSVSEMRTQTKHETVAVAQSYETLARCVDDRLEGDPQLNGGGWVYKVADTQMHTFPETGLIEIAQNSQVGYRFLIDFKRKAPAATDVEIYVADAVGFSTEQFSRLVKDCAAHGATAQR